LPCRPFLNPQNAFADFTTAIFHDRRLPIAMRSAQRLDQASGKSVFRQRRLKSIFVLELFTLLRGEISFQENFARILSLPYKNARTCDEKEKCKQSRTASLHPAVKRQDNPTGETFFFHRPRDLLERRRKVETFVCKNTFGF
jgi:hypothetical protein